MKLVEQVKKLRKEVIDNQDYIEQIEINDKKLRSMLKEKEQNNEGEKIVELKKAVNLEKRKLLEV